MKMDNEMLEKNLKSEQVADSLREVMRGKDMILHVWQSLLDDTVQVNLKYNRKTVICNNRCIS